MALANATLSPTGTTSPMPVLCGGTRTPGRSLAMEGVPHSIASTCTSPNDSVELRLGSTVHVAGRKERRHIVRVQRAQKRPVIVELLKHRRELARIILLTNNARRPGEQHARIGESLEDAGQRLEQHLDAFLGRQPRSKADDVMPV